MQTWCQNRLNHKLMWSEYAEVMIQHQTPATWSKVVEVAPKHSTAWANWAIGKNPMTLAQWAVQCTEVSLLTTIAAPVDSVQNRLLMTCQNTRILACKWGHRRSRWRVWIIRASTYTWEVSLNLEMKKDQGKWVIKRQICLLKFELR